jgi:hypothetical protein
LVVMPGTPFESPPVAVSVMLVPEGVLEITCKTTEKVALAFIAIVPADEQVSVPVPPTGGTELQVHPAGGVYPWNVIFGGMTSVNVGAVAAAGPVFVKTCVYVTLLPACTEVAEGVLVMTRFACVARATTSLAVAELFRVFGSVTADVTLTVWLIGVPAGVPAFTFTVKVIVPGVLGARLVSVHVSVASVHTHVPVPVNVCAVVFAGSVSVRLTVVAVLGPALLTCCV